MERVVLREYNPKWPELYEKETKNMRNFVPKSINCYFYHIGSTAIPGCLDSGTMDIVLATSSILDLITIRDVLAIHGYDYFEKMSSLHHYVIGRRVAGEYMVLVHIIHVVNPILNDMLNFRDHLIRNNRDRDTYNELRKTLVSLPNISYKEYNNEKIKFQKQIIRLYR